MKRRYIFRRIESHDIPDAFIIVLERIRWMDENGIRQWNVTDYTTAYPLAYYEKCCENGELFVLADAESGEIVCLGALKSSDAFWKSFPDFGDALYLHNFASKPTAKGVGSQFLSLAEAFAVQSGKRRLRLDSAEDNLALARFYESRGYVSVGRCTDGPYTGILREKKL